ncbi:hypothetical protein MDA_GLEAN10003779 [Myotis davidii]|uniref:Secreted protein n=1 Tax=Myotis davidii TaxID=225400 RepID=L5LRW7_MYODS|nr:hypothetical protein MDA_GLEAN10003779 [Myotis davidii]
MNLWMLMVYSLVTTSLIVERPFFFLPPFFAGAIVLDKLEMMEDSNVPPGLAGLSAATLSKLMVPALLTPADSPELLVPVPAAGVSELVLSVGVSSGCCPNCPQEQGEVEKPWGAIRAGSCYLHPLMAPSDQGRCQVLAAGVSSGSGASSGCKWSWHQQQV